MKTSKGQNQTYFWDSWLEDDSFKRWLTKAPNKKRARCKLCKKSIELSSIGKKALTNHATVKKHSEKDIKMMHFSCP